ncbi:hypothetical protein C8A01DRAFT_40998 [Parachaetomium inaequale]|uniref:Uncharacterized protein n=1 Tax=Parachaetomium inaequale TaxID=2588326 RepID=A0AAN6SMA7_9PEZI|nr:hypothetical protein C8A01DRAFT_40998 [Parachaetomium inaequale]
MRELVESPLGDAYTIKDALEIYRLSDWGFVLFRCTYGSQEKWEKFVALVQGHARECFEQAGMMDVYARMRWTVFEDAAALDDAGIVETSRRFVEWVEQGPGGRELAGSVFGPTIAETDTPRHIFFLYVDEESLESVVDDTKARAKGGYFCTVVRADNVVRGLLERDQEKGVYYREGRELEEDEMEELRKRVRIDHLVCLYAELQVSLDCWYDLLWFDDNIFVP